MGRPFTRTHKVLSDLFPACAGIAFSGILTVLTTEPNWFWGVQAAGFILLIPCALARLHRRRRWYQLDLITHQRGWREGHADHHLFTEDEVDEIGRLQGKWMAQAIRDLGSRERVQ